MTRTRYVLVMIAFGLSLGTPAATHTQIAAPQTRVVEDDPRLSALPAALRERGRQILAEPDEDRRGTLARNLARADAMAALDFLISLLNNDPSGDVREDIVNAIKDIADPRVDTALEQRIAADPDVDVSIISLELRRARATRSLMKLLQQRLASERKVGQSEALDRLIREQERWTSVTRGTLLPTFLQTPPAPFSVASTGQRVRVLAFGDFGDGSASQHRVAAAMLQYHQRLPFDFAVTLGDNFYSKGMMSPADPRWRTEWSALYDPLKIRFYATLGNHDYGYPNSPAAEILFTHQSESWRMPAAYYTFTAGPVQFFALDTDIIADAQLQWLASELDRSRATWKVVYGHHPIYSEGRHEDNNAKIDQLLPVVRDRADIYLAGHDHDMQHLKPEGRLHFFIAGSGGKLRPITPGPRSLFAKSANGFAVLDADDQSLTVAFVETDLSSPYSYQLTRTRTSS